MPMITFGFLALLNLVQATSQIFHLMNIPPLKSLSKKWSSSTTLKRQIQVNSHFDSVQKSKMRPCTPLAFRCISHQFSWERSQVNSYSQLLFAYFQSASRFFPIASLLY